MTFLGDVRRYRLIQENPLLHNALHRTLCKVMSFSFSPPGPGVGIGVQVTAIVNPPNPQPGVSVQFTATVSGGKAPYTFAWWYGDGGSDNSQNPSHIYATAGSYQVTAKATDSLGVYGTASIMVTVGWTPAQPRMFGFGFISPGGLVGPNGGYMTAQQFFNGYFMTPPYPSTVEFTSGQGCGELAPGKIATFLVQLQALCSPYPKIKLGMNIGFDASDQNQYNCFTAFLDYLKANPGVSSWGFIGPQSESFNVSTAGKTPLFGGWEQFMIQYAKEITTRLPSVQVVGYYPGGYKGPGGVAQLYTNSNHAITYMAGSAWPNANPPPNPMENPTFISQAAWCVGVTYGGDGGRVFPSVGGNPSGCPEFSFQPFAENYLPANPPVGCTPIHNIITHAGFPESTVDAWMGLNAARPLANAQWNICHAGNRSSQYNDNWQNFIKKAGATGKSTWFLWDDLQFRARWASWIAAHPGFYVLSK